MATRNFLIMASCYLFRYPNPIAVVAYICLSGSYILVSVSFGTMWTRTIRMTIFLLLIHFLFFQRHRGHLGKKFIERNALQ